MSRFTTAHFSGGEDLAAALKRVAASLPKGELETVLVLSGRPVEAEMKLNAARLTGASAESIAITVQHDTQGGASIAIGPSRAHAYKLRFSEYGTAHQPARPVLRPAWETKKGEAIAIMKAETWKRMTDAAKAAA